MKILLLNFILHTAENGVITKRESNKFTMIYAMARGFKKSGHDVTLLASEEYRPLKEENPGFDVIFFKSRFPKIFRPDLLPFPAGLSKWLKLNSNRYDLAISSDTFMIPSLLAARNCKCKLVIWHELSDYQKMMRKLPAKFWYNVVAKIFMRKIGVIARSENARQFIARFMPKVSSSIVDHGADSDLFFPGNETDNSFIVISQLIARKRIDSIIEKFSKLVSIPQYSGYILNIVGDGPERENLKKLAHSLGIEKNVIFHGYLFHTDAAPLGRRAKAFLINTKSDLNMVSVPESIVNGTPVLMNEVPNTAHFVNSNRLGIAKKDWDEKDLMEMIARYDEFHLNCSNIRDSLTNESSAKKIVDISENL